jgi:hypothetical protein
MMDKIVLNPRWFTRLPEILEYARRRDQTVEQAIVHLVNSGLSHYPGSLIP